MFNKLANRRMNDIDGRIRQLVDNQDNLSMNQVDRLNRLDRAHKFWRRIAG